MRARLCVSIAAAASITLAVLFDSAPIHAASTFTVISIDDTGGTCAAGTSPGCTLRQALASAADGDTIDFAPSLAGKTILLSGKSLVIGTSVTIDGSAAPKIAIDGNRASTVFEIDDSKVSATINALTIQNGLASASYLALNNTGGGIANAGTLTINNSIITSNFIDGRNGAGCGIFNGPSGNLTLTNTIISANSAIINSAQIFGGGLYNRGTLTIAKSTFTTNSAFDGGAIYSGSEKVTISDSTFSKNTAIQFGGGMAAAGVVTIDNTTFSGNSAVAGGAFANDNGTLMINNSTFSSNSATGGAAIYNMLGKVTINSNTFSANTAIKGGGYGGAIENADSLLISNSTFSGNAALSGGGIYTFKTATISNSTISGNKAIGSTGTGGGVVNTGTLNLESTIIAGNQATADPDLADTNSGSITTGTDNSLGYNLIGDGTGEKGIVNGQNHDRVGTNTVLVNTVLAPLKDNGGPTQTMALQAGSPALGRGFCGGNSQVTPAAPAVTTDQRGAARKTTCDIGAFEKVPFKNTPTPVPTAAATSPSP